MSQKPAAAPPLKRARAPTITVDTSALNENEQPAPEFSSPTSPIAALPQNPNSLVIPITQRPRGDSLESTNSISTSSVGSQTYVGSSPSPSLRERSNSTNTEILDDETALKPDPGHEAEFVVENNPFAFSPGQLSKLINPKNYGAFHALRGLAGLEKGLRTKIFTGLSIDEDTLPGQVSFQDVTGTAAPDVQSPTKTHELGRRRTSGKTLGGDDDKHVPRFTDRKRVYGDNTLPERKSKSFLRLAWMALQDKVLILLSVAAVVSLALGLYQTFGQTHESGARVEWVEGVAIIVAITIVVVVGAVNDWQKERQFVKLNKKKTDREVKVIRSGRTIKISVHDILVGDLMILEQGDVIPVDGIYISGYNVSCDESSATGESDILKKSPAEEVFKAMEEHRELRKLDPFIISGAKVQEGVGQFLVTATGVNSSHGRTLLSLREDTEVTPLQLKLNVLAGYIAKLGSAAGLLLFIVLFIEFCARLASNHGTPNEKAQEFIRILIVAVTVIVVAVPEGLPLAVTLALAFATKRMTRDHNLVRHLQSCETMGNATVICTDKTGTLTENVMTVVGGNLGASQISFSDSNMSSRLAAMAKEILDNEDADSTLSSPTDPEFSATPASEPTNPSQNQISMSELSEALSSESRALLKESVAINSTAFEGEESGKPAFIGSKTETALLDWAKNYLGLGTLNLERANLPVVQLFPFNSGKKCMAAVVKKDQKTWRMFLKGAPEIVIAHCNQIIEDPAGKLNSVPLTEEHSREIKSVISTYASLSLRTIGLAYRDFDSWPPKDCRRQADDPKMTEFDEVFGDLTWISVVGIQDPVRNGVSKAISDCQRAGVRVIMVTGDNIETARAIARETGIMTGQDTSEALMEGPDFRRINDFERQNKIEKLCVLARSSPEDKRILVKTLRSQGHVVAATGDGTNDAQALKAADVGFSMGITGTEVAKEASDIILMDDNFSSIVKALAWGRAVNDAVKKFLQFQITVNITAVILTFVSAVSSATETSTLNAVQLLWVNLIMDTFAALALATDPPSYSLLGRQPEPRNKPLIDITMWKMIISQAILQLGATFVLYFAGPKFLHYESEHQSTLVFNAFVWMQIFNALNCRRIDNRLNIFEGILKNWLFMAILGIMIGGQIIIVFVGGAAFVVKPLTGVQWAISIVIGILSLPAGALIRCIPDSAIRTAIRTVLPAWLLERHQKKNTQPSEEQYLWTSRVSEIRDDLAFFRRVHGGRLSEIKYNITHPKHALERSRSSRSGSRSPMHSAIAMSGSLAGSIGVGDMSPIERPRTSFDTRGNSSRSNAGHMV